MDVKFEKYFKKSELLNPLSMIPDPCFKMDGMFGSVASHDENMRVDHSSYKDNYHCLHYKMYNEYN